MNESANNNIQSDVVEIDLKRIVETLMARIKLVILIVFVCGASAFLISKFVAEPVYSTRITMYINNNRNSVSETINSNDISAAAMLATTYVEMIKSNSVLNEVAQRLQEEYEVEYDYKEIMAMISASAVNETQILEVRVSNTNPQHAKLIADEIANIAPEKITDFVEGSSIKIIDYATLPLAPSSPNVALNTIVGLFLGCILSLVVVMILEPMDTRIKSEEDLEKLFNIPIIGIIPEIEVSEK